MSDADLLALATRADGPRWQECRVHYALRTVPTPSASLLAAAVANEHAPTDELVAAINARIPTEWAIDGGTVRRHRAGGCKCGKCSCETCAQVAVA